MDLYARQQKKKKKKKWRTGGDEEIAPLYFIGETWPPAATDKSKLVSELLEQPPLHGFRQLANTVLTISKTPTPISRKRSLSVDKERENKRHRLITDGAPRRINRERRERRVEGPNFRRFLFFFFLSSLSLSLSLSLFGLFPAGGYSLE